MEPGFQPVDPQRPPGKSSESDAAEAGNGRKRGRRAVPFRLIAPNLVTVLALCAGLTSVRMAIEGRMELAVYLVILAAILDAIDGRLARFLKGASRFGAELDSLADFVNFGVAPAILLFMWDLQEFRSAGWIASLVFAISAGLRLARFNAALDDPKRETWQLNYFTGVPAPAGAIVGLLPIYLSFLGVPQTEVFQVAVIIFVPFIGLLMVSNIPTYSGKLIGASIRPDLVFPIIIAAVGAVALLATFTWTFLTVMSLIYLAVIPFGWLSHRKKQRESVSARVGEQDT
ncbi:MAG: CDP-diacylglycerol--serine O-phosphatidyltransferase [Pseudomonadota bacterium]